MLQNLEGNLVGFENLLYWLFLFFVFSVMGWVIESVFESLHHKRVINRGSLAGPYIPIYGIGGVLFSAVGPPLRDAYDNLAVQIILVFFICALLATALEYIAGSIMERLFKRQFWDYSTLKLTAKFTYKNRISLFSSVFFGVAAIFVTFWFYDVISAHTLAINDRLLAIVCFVMVATMGTDIFLQVRKYIRIRDILKKLSLEKLQEFQLKSLLRMGGSQQIREFRDMVREKLQEKREEIQEKRDEIQEKIQEKYSDIKEDIKNRLPIKKAEEELEENSEEEETINEEEIPPAS